MQERHILISNRHFKDLNVLICGEQTCAPSHSFGPAMREYYLIHYVFAGKGKYRVKGKTHTVQRGQMFIIRPYEVTHYQADAQQPWQYCWIGFECGFALPEWLSQNVLSAPECEHIFRAMRTCGQRGEDKELFLCAKLYELFAMLGHPQPRSAQDGLEAALLKAQNHIEQNYVNPISVNDLAESLNLNRSYFSTAFKKQLGKSPQQYIVDFRLEKAAELLSLHGFKPGEAARSCGYTDIFNFSKMFKRKYGQTPSQYAARFAGHRPPQR